MRLIQIVGVEKLEDVGGQVRQLSVGIPTAQLRRWRKNKSGAFVSGEGVRGTWNAKTHKLKLLTTTNGLWRSKRINYKAVENARGNDTSWTDLGPYYKPLAGWSLPMLAIYRPYQHSSFINSGFTVNSVRVPEKSRLEAECFEAYEKANRIKIPTSLRRGQIVGHFYDHSTNHIGFQIGTKQWMLDETPQALVIEPWLSLLTHDSDYDDYSTMHSMTKMFFDYYWTPAGRLWTKTECERFFNDNENFYAGPLNVERQVLRPADIGFDRVFSINALKEECVLDDSSVRLRCIPEDLTMGRGRCARERRSLSGRM